MHRISTGLLIALVVLVTATVAMPAAAQTPTRDIPTLLGDLGIAPIKAVPAPEFSLTGLDGKRWTLGELKGRAALLYFWATW